MKVNVIGMSNAEFMYCTYLRGMGIESEFFHLPLHPLQTISREVDSRHGNSDSDFVHEVDFLNLSPWSGEGQALFERMSNCDAMYCTGLGAIWAHWSGKPYLYRPFGGDVGRWPFKFDTPQEALRSMTMRTILLNADIILGGYHNKRNKESLDVVGVEPKQVYPNYHPIDSEAYRPFSEQEKADIRKELGCEDSFVLFLPAQLMIKPIRQLNYAKGTDIFLRGIRQFMDNAASLPKDVRIWITNRGDQKDLVEEIIDELGLADIITWLPHADKKTMIKQLNACDILMDQIFPPIGNHGMLTVEGMSCGTPVFGYADNEYRVGTVGEAELPICNSKTPEEVATALAELYADPQALALKGRQGREFVIKHHHWETVMEQEVGYFRELAQSRGKVQQLRQEAFIPKTQYESKESEQRQ